MTRYDSEFETTSDSEVGDAAEGSGRFLERHQLPLKVALFYVGTLAVTLLAYRVVDGKNMEPILALAVWFTAIFAVLTAVMGVVTKLVEAAQRRPKDTR
jgi:hypothetical protein